MIQKLVTIDGPAASGKSSVSRLLAAELGWKWVSTGAFYRGLALAALKSGLDVSDEEALVAKAADSIWKVEMTSDYTLVFFDGKDVTDDLAGEEVGGIASKISGLPGVRKALLERQRRCFNQENGLVAEGRDCGTVVFPQATAKLYLTASPALRARRRAEEEGESQSTTLEQQIKRDKQDTERKVSPLTIAEGALKIDTSFLSLEEVVTEALKYVKSQGI
ncbi:MAG: (d)CMP kinase [Pseudomonadota bacterium]